MGNKDFRIAIIGLGYVGLPLAVEFSKKYKTVGFDIDETRVSQLQSGIDRTLEISDEHLKTVNCKSFEDLKIMDKGLWCSNQISDIANSNIFIITVPTPTDKFNRPVLTPLHKASETVGKVLKKGDIVVYESTVYPGVTEDECIPVLEKISGLVFNKDFFAGYSPETN
jgi:UDP-N-acetyl-D-galactosamine dehydrogenase